MKLQLHIFSCVFLGFCVFRKISCGNILVWHTEGSHWINLKPVLDTLVDRGHSVTVLAPNMSFFMDTDEPSRYHYEMFNVSLSLTDRNEWLEDYFNFSFYEMDQMNLLQIYIKFYQLLSRDMVFRLAYCDGILQSELVMDRLLKGKYDMIFADPIHLCSDLVAETLDVPLVYTLRYSAAHILEGLCGKVPVPPSYVPGALSKFTDKMTFSERVQNFLFYAVMDVSTVTLWTKYDKYYRRSTTYCEMMGKADLWLIRTYWDFEYPRPLLPNFKYVGGIHCSPAKQLPKDLEDFVQSSGDDGVVVFTLGSMVDKITKEKSNIIAAALGQIPQKVLWRYSGERPDTLAPNTRLCDWLPQNDLLGHAKTKAFITHGGTNGIYEAIYHGVPMVGIPLFGDQSDNMVHMKAKGAAVIMDFNSMQTEDLVEGLKAVINDPSYKENAMRLSRIYHDRPVSPRDEAVFWIEFVMRHKGARHLRAVAYNLTWYQYHSLDVFAFLLATGALALFIAYKIAKFCIIKCCFRSHYKRKND
ncbi:UDP-glucuronosyltransferase 2A2 isoform X2 [Chanos chanos]|uniref:UDP-glucuronosyltransferase n=1 Tax=Chanos chanos TaxID=29144 RepID=A0A6J2V385_CHACN|nr:UDP-glucuronosyltransferase 2A2-like isoform X2 [Chanos chanos]